MRTGAKRTLSASAMGGIGLLAFAVVLLSLLALSTKPSEAAPPPTTMNFQGRLADSSGNLMPDGLYNMQFRLFTVSSGGSAVWTETRENNGTDYRVQVTNGLFSTQLGEANALSASLFNATDLYFEITMATPATANCATASCATWESPMTPRQKLATSAYAFNAANAESLNGFDETDFGQITANNTWTGQNTVSLTDTEAFKVQNASSSTLLLADTSAMNVQVGGDLLPTTTSSFDIGSTALRWEDLYLNNTIVLGTDTDNASIAYDGTNDVVTISNPLHVSSVIFNDATTAADGTKDEYTANYFGAPTISATNSNVTTDIATTFKIQGAPAAGANQSFNEAYALWVASSACPGSICSDIYVTEADQTITEADETVTEADETVTEADETVTEADQTPDLTELYNNGELFGTTWGGSSSDYAESVIEDSAGNYVIAGYTTSYGAGSNDAFIAQFNSSGVEQWSKTWGGGSFDNAESVIEDSAGNYVIAGSTSSYGAGSYDAFIAQFNSSGVEQWSKTWGSSGYDAASSVIENSAGNYVIVGETGSYGAGSYDAFIATFNSSGVEQWSKTWGSSGYDAASSVIEDSAGNYVIAGSTDSYGAGNGDAFIAQFNSSGVEQWSKTWGGGSNDYADSVIEDSAGNYVITGSTDSYGAGSYDAFIAQFNSSGVEQWSKTWGGSEDEYAYSVIEDTTGNYVVVGSTVSYGAGVYDTFIATFNTSGVEQWSKTWGGGFGDFAKSVIEDSTGNYVLAGTTFSYGAGSSDVFIAMVESSGIGQSTTRLDGATDINGRLEVDGNSTLLGNVAVGTGTSNDSLLNISGAKSTAYWGQNGIQLNIASGTYNDSSSTDAQVVAFNTIQQSILTADSATTTQNAATMLIQGAPAAGLNQTVNNSYALWVANGGCPIYICQDITITEADQTITEADETVTEADETITEADETVTEADQTPDLTELYNTGELFGTTWGGGSDDSAESVIEDSAGNYVIVGSTESYGAGNDDAFIAQFNSSGVEQWSKTWGGGSFDNADSVIEDSAGNYVIAGRTLSYGAGGYDAFIAQFNSSGVEQWSKTWGGADTDYANSVIEDSAGNYVIVGETHSYGAGGRDAFIAQFNSSGVEQWSKTWGGADTDSAYSVIEDSAGNYVLVGQTASYGAGYNDAFIAQFNSSGVEQWSKTWGGVLFDYGFAVIEDSAGNYVIAGRIYGYGAGGYDAFIAQFNSSGVEQWSKTWGGGSTDQAESVFEDSAGNYVIAGYTDSYGAGNNDAFIAQFNSSGVEQWSKTWGGVSNDYAYSAVEDSTGNYVVVGYTGSYGADNSDAFIARFVADGRHIEVADSRFDGNVYVSDELAIGGITQSEVVSSLTRGELLGEQIDYESGEQPREFDYGDFDDDGNLDVVVANAASNYITVYSGDGDGTFSDRQDITANSGGSNDVATADFDKDGNLDILAIENQLGTASSTIHLGNGDMTFETKVDYVLTGCSNAMRVTIDDFDNDTYPDFVVACYANNQQVVVLNDGDGTFTVGSSVWTGGKPRAITSGYFDSDNYVDIAITREDDYRVSVFINDGSGGFPTRTIYDSGYSNNKEIIADDANNDGITDLLLTSFASDKLHFLSGNGDGTFTRDTTSYSVGDAPLYGTYDDIDNDGMKDVVVSHQGVESGFTILYGKAGAGFSFEEAQAYRVFESSYPLTTADFDNDGIKEIAVGSYSLDVFTLVDPNQFEGTRDSLSVDGRVFIKTTEDSRRALLVKSSDNTTVLGIDSKEKTVRTEGSFVVGTDTDNASIAYDGTNDVVTISNPLHVDSVIFNDTTTAADGTKDEYTANYFGAPTISATNSNVTTDIATTFKIQGAPAAGANQSFNEAYALWVDSDGCPPQFCQVQYVDHETLSITETDQAVTPVSMVISEADQTPTVVDHTADTSLLYETDDLFALGRVSGGIPQPDNDGNIVLVGTEGNISGLGSSAMTLTKVDANNEVVWQKAFGGTGYDYARDLAIDSNNDYIVAGDTSSYGAGSQDAVISKFDSDGVEQWTKTWGGTGNDGFVSVMVDSNGDYIAVGDYDSWGASAGLVIVKFDSSGVEQWSQRWGGSGSGIDVAEDGSGNYIVSSQSSSFGSGDQDAVLTKFNSSGVEQWTKTWGGSQDEYVNQVIVDSNGDFVVQTDTESYGLVDGGTMLSKFNSNGVEQWTVAIDGVGYEGMYGLIENSDGNYVAVGETASYGQGYWDALIVEYDTDGNVVWAKTWGGENYDGAYWITETASGVYAIGGNSENFGMNNESFIAEVTGTPQSISRFDGVAEVNGISRVNGDSEVSGALKVGSGRHGSAMLSVRGDRTVTALGANGIELAVGGNTHTNNGDLSSPVVAFNTIKQSTLQSTAAATTDNAATLLLQGSPISGSNQTITSSYALWVAGGGCSVGICTELELTETDRTITETNRAYTEVDRTVTETDQSVTEVDFTADSDVIYESIVNRAVRFDTRNYETLNDIIVDSNGDYVYAGSGYLGGSYQLYLIKFNWNDGVIWAKQWGGNGYEGVPSVAQDGSGNYIVAGYTESFGAGDRDVMVTKLNSSGIEQWTKTWGGVDWDEARSVIVDSSGDIVVTGHTRSYSAGAQDLFLMKLDSNGIEQWSKTVGGLYSDVGYDLIEDAAGDYVVAGFYNSDALITKFNSSGIVQWSKTLNGSGNEAYGIIQDSSNDYVIAGRNGSWGEAYISKLNSSGVEQWTKSIDYEATSSNDEYLDIAVDNADNYIVAGNHYSVANSSNLSYITKYDTDGVEQWSRHFNGPGAEDMIEAVDIDGNGEYVFGGFSSNFNYGPIIARMSASGATSFDGDGDARFDGKIHANNQIAIKTDSTTALDVQNAAGTSLLTADSTTMNVTVNGALTVSSGNTLAVEGDTFTNIDGYATPAEGQITYDTTNNQLLTYSNGKWKADSTDAILVAASNSSQADKNAADYVADGEDSSGSGIGTLDGDQIEINTALTAGAGKKVVLLAGTYTIDASISIPNNTTLSGVGPGTIIQLGNFGATSTNIDAIVNTDTTTGTGVVIRDLKLDGRDSVNTSGLQYGIALNNMGDGTGASARDGATISDVIVTDFSVANVVLTASDNNTIQRNTIKRSDASYPVTLDQSNNNMITDNVIQGNFGGISLLASTNNIISGNLFDDNSWEGIDLNSTSGDNTVTDNVIKGADNNNGISVSSSNNTITDNTVKDGNANGIAVYSPATDNVVSNNLVDNMSSYGIRIGGNRHVISNNTINNSGGTAINHGLYLSDADNSTITGNTITDTQCDTTCYAINIANAGSDNNYLEANVFSDTDVDDDATINDAGTNTIYANQSMTAGGLDTLFKQSNSDTAFQVQNATGTDIFTIDTNNSELQVGSATTDSTAIFFMLDQYDQGTDPANTVNGAMYYNTNTNKFRCYQNGGWTDCVAGASIVGSLDSQTKSANGAVISGDTVYLQSADASNPGLVNTSAQTIAGAKTFTGAATFSALGTGLSVTNDFSVGDDATIGSSGADLLTVNADAEFNNLVDINDGNDLDLNAGSASTNDAGDIVFRSNDGTERARLYSLSSNINGFVIRTNTSGNNTSFYNNASCIIGSGTGNTSCTSDARKKNIQGAAVGNLEKIMQLQPTYYTWKSDSAETLRIGLIAQEVQEVLPEVVITDHNGYLQLDYGVMVTPLIGAVQEQQAAIEDVRVSVAELQAANSMLDGGTINGDLDIGSNLNVSGNTTLQNLAVKGDAVFEGQLVIKGDLEVSNIIVKDKIVTAGDTPTIQVSTAAGEADAVNEIGTPTAVVDGNDTSGTITFTTGANTADGELVAITFSSPYSDTPRVVFSPANGNSSRAEVYYDATTATPESFRLWTDSALEPGKEYVFNYWIVE